MSPTRHTLVALLATTAALALTTAAAEAAGTHAGAARAAKRHTIAYVKRYGIVLRNTDLGQAIALEVLRLRQRRPVHRHADRGLLDPSARLPGAQHRHRLRRVNAQVSTRPPAPRQLPNCQRAAGTA
jgi:hypothetical protein